ncbi:SNF2 domain-containing protein CLASSY 2-like [Silene latifolia]|uniref:SNF2 domain-containing protein CLASSY 2-like n=1 Tax=Silene latifolia TaxID=37657 RepID=UPI003D76B586
MTKRGLHQSLHPFDEYPFEVFFQGSWKTVERLRINDGNIIFNFLDLGYLYEKKLFLPTLRLRPRRATIIDCTCTLRRGAEVSVFSKPKNSDDSSEESPTGRWFDARISSIERTPHENKCECKFYVRFFHISDNGGTDRKKLKKEVESVGIDQISVFQVLPQKPSEGTFYRWNLAEDCTSVSRTKLFLAKFASDISWLLVASVEKKTIFDVLSIQNKIVYQILDGSCSSYSTDVHLSAVNLRKDGGVIFSSVYPFVPVDNYMNPQSEEVKDLVESNSVCEVTELRRSKRRHVQPQRYLGEIGLEAADMTGLRIGWKRLDMDDDLAIVLANDDETDGMLLDNPEQGFDNNAVEIYSEDNYLLSRIGAEAKDEKLVKDLYSAEESEGECVKRKRGRKSKKFLSEKESKRLQSKKDDKTQLAIVPVLEENSWMPREQSDLQAEMRPNRLNAADDNVPLKFYRRRVRVSRATRTRKISELDDFGGGSRYATKTYKYPMKRYHHPMSRASRRDKNSDETQGGPKKTLDIGVYKDLISTYMKNIQLTIENKQPIPTDAWKNLQGASSMYEKKAADEAAPPPEEEEEESETEMLFREMELCLASAYYLDEENSKAKESDPMEKFFNGDPSCKHVYIIDDEIGVLCRLCGYVITEIRDVSPEFMRPTGFSAKHERADNRGEKDDTEQKLLDEACTGLVYHNPGFSDTFMSEPSDNDNVWGIIPSIKKKLHDHQKKAFEFLWRNLAGSLIPSEMEPSGKKVGGCVISHSPGAGKTFLIIAFLISYLKMFPGKRPLVLAPKTTLYTWYKEIIKWQFPVPVYQIHGRKTYRDRIYNQKVGNSSSAVVPNGDIMHVLDCLEKVQKWHAHPSVLLMGYTSFMSLMREDSKYAHRRYMGQILRESPGILILDEGHNPRSTKSRLRKALMRVGTEFRILLSGTLFQNNFGEYFNTLCLARPNFVNEVLRVLDPKYKKKIKGQNKTRTSIENRARKVFMDIIARKINSNDLDERADGLNLLRNLTTKFIDVYEGGSAENLPGLQSYTLMMKPTPLQHEILVRLHQFMNVARGFPLELELMITLGSIHPWLIRSAVCAGKFLSAEELESLDQYKMDPTKGSKVKFVLGLVQRSIIRKEKVLIFCHNIAPINLFLKYFEMIYGWKKGHEVLVLQGDLELFERGRVMDRFEERGGPSKVLLASINACAEGITLTAASRVVLLDSEWNPSKQKQAIARAFRPGQEKIVYVYQLLATGTLEEDKYGRTTWKEWVSCMIFSEEHVDDPSKWQAEKIEDALLREIVEEDHAKSFHMIMKNEKASYENPLREMNE